MTRDAIVAFSLIALVPGCKKRRSSRSRAPVGTAVVEPTGGQPASDADVLPLRAQPPEPGGDELVIDFVNAGQGDCIHIGCPTGESILVDCGSTANRDPDIVPIVSGLISEGKSLSVVVSHLDGDHYNLIENVVGDVAVETLLVGGRPHFLDGTKEKVFLEWLSSRNATYVELPLNKNMDLACGPDVSLKVLAANYLTTNESKESSHTKNRASIVLLVERAGYRVLLSGDATRDTEAWILETYPASGLDIDVLKVAHHGALTSTTDQKEPESSPAKSKWLEVLSPSHVVFTAGRSGGKTTPARGNRHPRCLVVDASLAQPEIETAGDHEVGCWDETWQSRRVASSVWSSCESGHLRLTVNGEGDGQIGPVYYEEEKTWTPKPGAVCVERYR